MAKAALLETQSLGLKSQGGRTLIETSTEEAYKSSMLRLLYSLASLSVEDAT
jgi:hypothetical protein